MNICFIYALLRWILGLYGAQTRKEITQQVFQVVRSHEA